MKKSLVVNLKDTTMCTNDNDTCKYQRTLKKYFLPLDCLKPNFATAEVSEEVVALFCWIKQQFQETTSYFSGGTFIGQNAVRQRLIYLYKVLAFGSKELTSFVAGQQLKLPPNSTHSTLELKHKFKIYDDYFGVARYEGTVPYIFLDQVLIICRDQVSDLLDSQVSLAELAAGLNGMKVLFDMLTEDFDVTSKKYCITEYSLEFFELPKSYSKTPLTRWRIGHLYFNLLLIFSADSIEKALKSNALAETVKLIRLAAVCFRASTSAMWFASTFSPIIYNTLVRPSMISTKAPGGFSGTQNREYEYWRIKKDELISKFSTQTNLDKALVSVLKEFEAIYLQDGEQHILIAAEMVKNNGSLVQIDLEKKYNVKMKNSAVDLLREIFEIRRDEFSFLKTV